MARPATARLKCNPPLGRLPVLQYLPPATLAVDPAYQRSLETAGSQTLIRKIAQHWNWDLCQPLVVSRRTDGGLYVIDGQHRLEASKMRGDIGQLPCVVVEYAGAADEAASFVHLNQQRTPLKPLDVFRAAVASEDPESCAIVAAIDAAGLTLAPHSNYTAWKPGMVSNIGGIQSAWRSHGERAAARALQALAQGLSGQVLRYAGTIYPGVAALCADGGDTGEIVKLTGSHSQQEWRTAIMRHRVDQPDMSFAKASAAVFRAAWARRTGAGSETAAVFNRAAFRRIEGDDPSEPARAWCTQCERRVTEAKAAACLSPFCKMKVKAA